MIVLLVEKAAPSLRGELTRWLIEPHSGVFVGCVSARVRDLLWQRVCRSIRDGAAILIYPAPVEQGFVIRSVGETTRLIEDFEGVTLIKRRIPAK